MAINLKKGQGINLTKAAPKLRVVRVGIGWDITRLGHHTGSRAV